jgi:NAD(P)H dehydrogenase (quinone)
MSNNQPALLVTGASGQLGRRVVELLLEAGEKSIIATTRAPDNLADFSEQGVTVREADFDDPASLTQAFAGADRLLLISTDAMDMPGRRIKQHQNAVKAAADAGVRHVLYTSIINPDADSPIAVVPDHRATEAALTESTLDWTFLRHNIYAEVALRTLNQAVQMGQLFSAAGDGKTGYVTREDCAQTAAATLRANFDGRRTLDITGPAAVSQAELASIAANVTGQPVAYVSLEPDVMMQNMLNAGLPQPLVEMLITFQAGTAQSRLDVVSSTVAELTGHEPTSVADFLAAHREALLAPPPAH